MSLAPGVASLGSTTSATSATTTGVATQAAGSGIIVAVIWRDTVNFTSIADNKGNSANYVQIGTEIDDGSSKSRWYYCKNAAGGAGHTATITVSGAVEISVMFFEIKGVDTTAAVDKTAQATNDATSPFTSTATATTTQAAEMLVGFLHGGGGVNPSTHTVSGSTPAAAGWTIPAGSDVLDGTTLWTGCLAYIIVAATGAYEAGFTETSATAGSVSIATIKEGAAGAAVSLIFPRLKPVLAQLLTR